jgi:putative ABC transport system permease protein
VDAILHDFRDAARRLRRSPRFAVAAISLLAFGFGANIAAFTVLHALLLQPLPYANPHRLVRIWESHPERGIFRSAVSPGNLSDWRERATSFEYIERFAAPRDHLVRFGSNDPEIVRQAAGSERFLEMLGVTPLVGSHTEGIVLSYRFWQRRFGGNPGVVGTKYLFEGFSSNPATVVGVMPEGFDFPTGAEAWGLIVISGTGRAARNVNVLARIKPDVSFEQARAEMDALAAALAAEHPVENGGWRVDMAPLHETIVGDARPALWLLYGAVCLVLLIAISNVGGLLLARLTQFERDTAVRSALGASLPRLLRQQLIESMFVAGAGGLVGIAIAAATIQVVLALAPPTIPRLDEIAVDLDIISAASVLAGVVGLLLWLLAAIGNRRLKVTALTAGGRQANSRWSGATRSVLMVGQVAFCVALLVLSALVVRSFVALQGARYGFEPGGVLTVQIRHPIMKPGEVVKHYPTQRFARVTSEIVNNARELPDVVSAAGAWHAPLARASAVLTDFKVLERPVTGPLSGAPPLSGPDVRQAVLHIVTPAYFETLRIPLLAGRQFDAADRLGDREIDDRDAPRGTGVAIVSESLAANGGTIGRHLAVPIAFYRSVEVIGIAADVRTALGAPPASAIYLPYAQAPISEVTILVHTASDPLSVAAALREKLRTFGEDISAFNIRTMDDIMTTALARPRFSSAVMSWFGAAGALFTAAGLYSLLSFLVAQRSRELAVRVAIGAGRRHIVWLVVGRGLRLTVVGTVMGAGVALLGMEFVRSAVPEMQPADPWILAFVAGVVLAIASLASYVPARRATRIDPIAALRVE